MGALFSSNKTTPEQMQEVLLNMKQNLDEKLSHCNTTQDKLELLQITDALYRDEQLVDDPATKAAIPEFLEHIKTLQKQLGSSLSNQPKAP